MAEQSATPDNSSLTEANSRMSLTVAMLADLENCFAGLGLRAQPPVRFGTRLDQLVDITRCSRSAYVLHGA